jgi:hypothetical protein
MEILLWHVRCSIAQSVEQDGGIEMLSKRLVTLIMLSAFLPCLTTAAAAGESKGEASRHGGQASTSMSNKGAPNTNAQWSADPEKGWVRADERHKLRDERRLPDKFKRNSGKHKSQNTKAGSTSSHQATQNGALLAIDSDKRKGER